MEVIRRYFPSLNAQQFEQFEALKPLYAYWNAQINVISRKDIDLFYEHHVLHSLGIAKVMGFKDNTHIMDVGTGGGFPGIPLAIMYPNCSFLLVDSIGKKMKVVQEVVNTLKLNNVIAYNGRAENVKEKFDFVVSRAVTNMPDFLKWIENKFNRRQNNAYPNGVFYLKGGDLTEELKSVRQELEINALSNFFKEEYFETKKVVYVRMVR
jgi:16S rRNA (guanine527-N7)-methyltransferase